MRNEILHLYSYPLMLSFCNLQIDLRDVLFFLINVQIMSACFCLPLIK